MSYGELLKMCRIQVGFSQQEMADKLKVSQSDISKFERDLKSIPADIFLKWIEITDRKDVAIALMYGVEINKIKSEMFNDDIYSKLNNIKS